MIRRPWPGPGRAGALVLVLGLAACAGRSGGEAANLPIELGRPTSADRGLLNQQCGPVEDPEWMPPLEDLARPGTRGNLSLATADFEAVDSVTLSVRYDEQGRLVWVRPIASTVGPERTESIEAVLFDNVLRDGPSHWGFRLKIGEDRAEVLPSIVCPVRVRQGIRRPVYPPRTVSARTAADRLGGLPVQLEIAIDERGRVVHVRLPQSTGDRGLDQYLIESVMEIDFFPRTHDGVPVPSTIRRSIRIP